MDEREQILKALQEGGYQDADIRLSQLVSRRALESHVNLGLRVRSCTKCNLKKDVYCPVVGSGTWNSPLMIVGDSPEPIDNKYEMPFIGAEGQLLSLIMAKAGLDRNSIYMTYAVKCGTADRRNNKPSEIQTCRGHIINEIETVVPQVILTLGETAMWSIRNRYELKISSERAKTHSIEIETLTGKKQVKVVHSYNMKNLLEKSEHQQVYKSAFWEDLNLALSTVQKDRPNYIYDRVGLKELQEKVKA